MKITSQKHAKQIIGNIAGQHIPAQIQRKEIKLFVGATYQHIGNHHYIQGCFYKEITRNGFIDANNNLWTWGELFVDTFNGQIEDKYSGV